MSEPIEFLVEDDMGVQRYKIVDTDALPDQGGADDRESYGPNTTVRLQQIHDTIRDYTRYALGAFRHLSDVEVKEVTLKFGILIKGECGLPILAKASTEGSFNIEVKCEFPKENGPAANTLPTK
jgi:Trypsin-co-occurring domain 1